MQANIATLRRTPPQIALPDFSDEVVEAEAKFAQLAAELEATQADCDRLQANWNVLGLKRGDGTPFPYPGDGRQAAFAELHFKISDLQAAKEAARRNVAEARRRFEYEASNDLTPAVDAVCLQAIKHVEEAMRLVETLSDVAAEARTRGLTVRHAQVVRAADLVRRLHEIRGTLAPTPTMGART